LEALRGYCGYNLDFIIIFNKHNFMTNLIPVPRVESRAPQKNTIEWEIPDKVLITYMLIAGLGYTVIIKIKTEKKRWWNKTWRNFMVSNLDPALAFVRGVDFLNKNGFMIDPDTIQFNEKIGNPDYFKNLGI
jgi:hypothetical protein